MPFLYSNVYDKIREVLQRENAHYEDVNLDDELNEYVLDTADHYDIRRENEQLKESCEQLVEERDKLKEKVKKATEGILKVKETMEKMNESLEKNQAEMYKEIEKFHSESVKTTMKLLSAEMTLTLLRVENEQLKKRLRATDPEWAEGAEESEKEEGGADYEPDFEWLSELERNR
jgi:chromosome segregation ATPase